MHEIQLSKSLQEEHFSGHSFQIKKKKKNLYHFIYSSIESNF
jgi:hypothetical protein